LCFGAFEAQPFSVFVEPRHSLGERLESRLQTMQLCVGALCATPQGTQLAADLRGRAGR
jgi:hypothetical protein